MLLEIETVASTQDIWITGQCGRVWRRTLSGSWTELKSQTSTHLLGISFPSANTGYFGGLRKEQPQHCVVRYTGP